MPRRPRRPTPAEALLQAFGRLTPRSQGIVLVTLLAVGLIVAGMWLYERHRQEQQASTWPPTVRQPIPEPPGTPPPSVVLKAPLSVQLTLGNPSGATAEASNRNNYLLIKPYFALSYNDAKGGPNWVSWRVTPQDVGDAPRKQTFDPDVALPPGYHRIQHRDYTGSGFDRGHMCPKGDRDATPQSSNATFVMSNIIPQAPQVNQKAWARLEDLTRRMVERGNHAYVISGQVGQGGTGLNGPATTIANGRVNVPAECWKVIVFTPGGEASDDLSEINAKTRVVCVLMPNRQDVSEDWKAYRCTAAEIETKTGYRFFDTLPTDVAQALRTQRDTGATP